MSLVVISYSIISNMIDNLDSTDKNREAIADTNRQKLYLTNLLLHTVQGTVSMFQNIVFSYWIFPSLIMIFHVRIPLSKIISAIY